MSGYAITNQAKKQRWLDDNDSSTKIVIVGGGLAGLSAALALEKAGFHQISLFEKDESFEKQKEGYGLTLTYNPKGPLAALGILEEVAVQDSPSRCHYVFKPDGSILGYFGNAFSKHRRGLGQRGNLRVPRKVLRKILMEQLKWTTIYWGHQLVDYEFDTGTSQYSIQFDVASPPRLGSGSVTPKLRTTVADLLVAADGIRSAILSKIYQQARQSHQYETIHDIEQEVVVVSTNEGRDEVRRRTGDRLPDLVGPDAMGLRYTNVRLILGIADFVHPLLYDRGFYTLDGKHRLFTMPYSCNRFDKSKTNRIMWQLSFAMKNDDDRSMALDPISLRNYVLQTCRSWHDPVVSMIEATPIEKIWGTDLMDRDPKQVQDMIQKHNIKRLVVMGDGLHTMTPFKGQGANQALADGPLLARCLQRGSIDAAVKTFWRETIHRTSPVVEASRKAAQELHSPLALQAHAFAGVKSCAISSFLQTLRNKNIGTCLAEKLDSEIVKVIDELNIAAPEEPLVADSEEQTLALMHAKAGDTPSLRQQSLRKHSESIRTARDEQNRGCVHWSVLGGHFATCHWLLTEVDCDPTIVDAAGKTASDYATHPRIVALFDVLRSEQYGHEH